MHAHASKRVLDSTSSRALTAQNSVTDAHGHNGPDIVGYKGTTLPHIVVKRAIRLGEDKFVTYQPERNPAAGKHWQLHKRCVLAPADASLIRLHERHLRKAGPLRAVATYARDKNVLKLVRLRCSAI